MANAKPILSFKTKKFIIDGAAQYTYQDKNGNDATESIQLRIDNDDATYITEQMQDLQSSASKITEDKKVENKIIDILLKDSRKQVERHLKGYNFNSFIFELGAYVMGFLAEQRLKGANSATSRFKNINQYSARK